MPRAVVAALTSQPPAIRALAASTLPLLAATTSGAAAGPADGVCFRGGSCSSPGAASTGRKERGGALLSSLLPLAAAATAPATADLCGTAPETVPHQTHLAYPLTHQCVWDHKNGGQSQGKGLTRCCAVQRHGGRWRRGGPGKTCPETTRSFDQTATASDRFYLQTVHAWGPGGASRRPGPLLQAGLPFAAPCGGQGHPDELQVVRVRGARNRQALRRRRRRRRRPLSCRCSPAPPSLPLQSGA